MNRKWARFMAMDRGELLDRGRQEFAKRWDAARYHLGIGFDDVGFVTPTAKPSFFFHPWELPDLLSLIRRHCPDEVAGIVQRAEKICRHQFDLLGYTDMDYGAKIDWHYDRVHDKHAPRKPWYQIQYLNFNQVGEVKIIWELNRHQHLVTLAKAFRLTENERFAAELFRQWEHWLAQNPYPMGVNWASSLEVAFRSLSSLWVRHLMADCPAVPEGFGHQLLVALAVHGRHIERYLSTYFSANTHLLGEGVALFFLGTLCPELPRATEWQTQGWEIVLRQAERQVQSDGMHFEQSTYYHVYALDFFLHARILAARNGITVPARFDRTLERMLQALANTSQGGVAPRYGDDDGGRVFDPSRNRAEHMLDPLAIGAALFNRDDFSAAAGGPREEALWLLGTQAVKTLEHVPSIRPGVRSLALQASGLYVMATPEPICAQLIVDAGIQGSGTAGHSHADALSIQLSADGRQLLSDPGTYEYVGDSGERDAFRGTGAHNTVRVDGQDQAQASAPFRWNTLPTVVVEHWLVGDRFDFFGGHQEGYKRLKGSPIHHRSIFSLKGRFWLVRDAIVGSGTHRIEMTWNLAPRLIHRGDTENLFVGVDGGAGLALLPAKEHGWSCARVNAPWSPAFGRKDIIPVVRFSSDTALPTEFATLLILTPPNQTGVGEFLKLTERGESSSVSSYRYREPDEDHWVFYAE